MGVTGSVNITEINDAIKDTLATASGMTYAQSYNELTAGIIDTPMLQVYWQASETDPTSGSAQSSFRGVTRQTDLTFHADLFPRQRSHIDEDMGALLPLVDAIQTKLEEQRTQPYFGQADIQAILGWTAQQVTFEYPEDVKFLGARFVIRVRVF